MRMDAKHKKLDQDFLNQLGLTDGDVKDGLKLPINAYTGTLRAKFSPMFDNLQGFSICTTCQLLLLQLVYDLVRVPTVEMCSTNTDAVKFYVDEQYKAQTDEVIHNWEKTTGFEMEEDHIVKSVMANVNNYAEIVQVGDDDYEVHYKGGFFRGKHKFEWNKEKHIFEYTFKDDAESNSLSICSEALLKNLLFDTPPEKIINECNDIFRFQKIAHLGSTYEKCVQETPNGDIELQRNNRVYAGKVPSGAIIKVKADGRRDSLADQPPYPIIDNDNQLTIDDIDKSWYIEVAKDWINRFRGVKRLTEYKKDELIKLAEERGIEIDKKMKKDEIIKLIQEQELVKGGEKTMNIYQKLNEIKKDIMAHDFVLDQVMPGNLGGHEFASIGQYYVILNEKCIKYGVFFEWEVIDMPFDIKENLFKPVTGKPSHVATVRCRAKFTNCDKPEEFEIMDAMASGSDICDKSVSGASTLAFRNFFDKNFTPKYLYLSSDEEINAGEEEKTAQPSIPAYIPPQKKEEITKEVVTTEQHEARDDDDKREIIDNIMKVRELTGKSEWGAATLDSLMKGELNSADILEIQLKVDAKLESLGGK